MRPHTCDKSLKAVTIGLVVAGAGILTGCAQPGTPITGSKEDSRTQSETAAATSYAGRNAMVVTYNDETGTESTIQYTPTGRKVLHGASLMGWSYSLDFGKTWKYGGKVNPPKGWAALWGDPAMTTSNAAYRYVFISNLAIPDSKMPAGGINGSVVVTGNDSYIGGACFARSSDGGITFQNYQCVTNNVKNSTPNTEKGHFYDGGSMASSRQGEIFAGFMDYTTGQIDVYRSPDANGAFKMLPNPFPNIEIYNHPRLRVDLASGALYVAGEATNHVVFLNRYANGQWGQPVQASDVGVTFPCIAFEPGGCDTGSTKLHLRTGPQFSFDIGAASDDAGSDAIRLLHTRQDPQTQRYYVTGYRCPLALQPGCIAVPQWGTTPGNLSLKGDQFNPNVSAWPGFIGLPPAWKATYVEREEPNPSKITLSQGNLGYLPNGTPIYVPFDLIKNQTFCPDQRGYWDDYDDMIVAGFINNSTTASFFRPLSDSSLGCNSRWAYTSSHLHVRGFVFQ